MTKRPAWVRGAAFAGSKIIIIIALCLRMRRKKNWLEANFMVNKTSTTTARIVASGRDICQLAGWLGWPDGVHIRICIAIIIILMEAPLCGGGQQQADG